MAHDPDPRTAGDDDENVESNEAVRRAPSATEPAEGRDDQPEGGEGSPQG